MEWKECSISIMVVIYSKFLHTLENSAQGFYTNHSTLIDFFTNHPTDMICQLSEILVVVWQAGMQYFYYTVSAFQSHYCRQTNFLILCSRVRSCRTKARRAVFLCSTNKSRENTPQMPERMPSITSVVAAGTEIITTLSINGSINFTRGSNETVTHSASGHQCHQQGKGA